VLLTVSPYLPLVYCTAGMANLKICCWWESGRRTDNTINHFISSSYKWLSN